MNPSTIRILYVICAIAFVAMIARAYMNVKGTDGLVPVVPHSEVADFAKTELDKLQQPSFEGNKELCGIIFETSDAELGVSIPRDGDEASCDISYFDEPGMVPVASFHTHGKHSDRYDGEVPSLIDIESDVATGMDGYVATPGGRLWRIDHAEAVAVQVCGPGCLTQDPAYEPCNGDPVKQRYTIDELQARFSSDLSC
ncbi:DUF4329 domain-containing protein [uncultured Erythrobacter sp.]|uniref:DUF4329 domain-containing protein n=1 Tax=uncultured Erythrobacter sp. TaxID=263913 RepID=UPI002626158C|nr:DUF4329 domain-containing protein [uncultured Erythrobacter sp.]